MSIQPLEPGRNANKCARILSILYTISIDPIETAAGSCQCSALCSPSCSSRLRLAGAGGQGGEGSAGGNPLWTPLSLNDLQLSASRDILLVLERLSRGSLLSHSLGCLSGSWNCPSRTPQRRATQTFVHPPHNMRLDVKVCRPEYRGESCSHWKFKSNWRCESVELASLLTGMALCRGSFLPARSG